MTATFCIPAAFKTSVTSAAAFAPPSSSAAVAAGAGGLLIEIHDEPECALCDGRQAITIEELAVLIPKLNQIRKAL